MTRNIGTSSRLAVMCGFAVGHILRSLERREVASDEVFPILPEASHLRVVRIFPHSHFAVLHAL
jgi:hypothetical protein